MSYTISRFDPFQIGVPKPAQPPGTVSRQQSAANHPSESLLHHKLSAKLAALQQSFVVREHRPGRHDVRRGNRFRIPISQRNSNAKLAQQFHHGHTDGLELQQ